MLAMTTTMQAPRVSRNSCWLNIMADRDRAATETRHIDRPAISLFIDLTLRHGVAS